MRKKRLQLVAAIVLLCFLFSFILPSVIKQLMAMTGALLMGAPALGAAIIVTGIAAVVVGLLLYSERKSQFENHKSETGALSIAVAGVIAIPPGGPEGDLVTRMMKELIKHLMQEVIKNNINYERDQMEKKGERGEATPEMLGIIDILVLAFDVSNYNPAALRNALTERDRDPADLLEQYGILADHLEIAKELTKNYTFDFNNLDNKFSILSFDRKLEAGRMAKEEIRNRIDAVLDFITQEKAKLGRGLINIKISQVDTFNYPAVISYISVADGEGEPVSGLGLGHFSISDNGVSMKALHLIPLTETKANKTTHIALLFDVSPSMEGEPLGSAKTAGTHFVSMLEKDDLASVTAFSGTVSQVHQFSKNENSLIESILDLSLGSSTAIYDAMSSTAQDMKNIVGRKVIVLLTDGEDNASSATLNEAIAAARQAGTTVFVVALGNIQLEPLQKIANKTGGRVFTTVTPEELTRLYDRISNLVKLEYKIDYFNPYDDQEFHMLLLGVRTPDASGSAATSYTIKKRD
jgi:VWFA-related protein